FIFITITSIIENAKRGNDMTYKIGQIIEGRVTGVQSYGVFVALDEATQGLIHISEIQSGYTKNIRELLKVGEKVQVQIIDIDEYTKKISLSKRTMEKQFVRPPYHRKHYFTNKNKKIGFQSIEDNLARWIRDGMILFAANKENK